ncbi:hypothetical protein [Okeania sp. SIO3I5]|uniref:hypothetical protein n=1 Tax=Okeania sp. SIO3I5 TaxID=2607805 RepID=UPI0025F4831F|nr:hypothetical protein [Okeania sp. SIO3I5]
MRLSPLLLDKLEAANQSGIKQSIEQGVRIERTAIIENLLIMKFNSLDEQLRNIIEPILSLSPQ